MTIQIKLSQASIDRAIKALNEAVEALRESSGDLSTELAKAGAEVAQAAYGKMAQAEGGPGPEEGTGVIIVTGDAPTIAEFGAGYATMESHPMAGNAPFPIRIGSYSQEHEGMFWQMYEASENHQDAFWMFGGRPYREVPPRHGLLDARDYILENAEEFAAELIRLR